MSMTVLQPLPQLVSRTACAQCDVCCRFPEPDSFLRPYFTAREIRAALSRGLAASCFDDPAGSQVTLVHDPQGEGCLCPAFDPATAGCRIYEDRPLDCALYPLALMWNAQGTEVVLGWDTKCPFMREALPKDIRRHAERVQALLQDESVLATLGDHPRLIGRYQEDVIELSPLPAVTQRLRAHRPDERLQPLRVVDAPRWSRRVRTGGGREEIPLAAYGFAYHYIWTSTLPYWWMEVADTFFLFTRSPDGWFMPLPPVGPGAFAEAVDRAFDWMRDWNAGSPVSRIEQVTDAQAAVLAASRYRWASEPPEYVYRAEALISLVGDAYKSQRALCNRVEREHKVEFRPYQPSDYAGCQALYGRWSEQKRGGSLDQMGRWLLEDAEAAHTMAWVAGARADMTGMVAMIDGGLAAYTFGYWLTPSVFAVLLEVADRAVPGLAQACFRETCRVARGQGAEWINAMDDAGLSGLREAKRAYHPAQLMARGMVTAR